MQLDKQFLGGLIVAILGYVLPLILELLKLQGVDLGFLLDGVITYRELIAFVGMLLMAISRTGQSQVRMLVQSPVNYGKWKDQKGMP